MKKLPIIVIALGVIQSASVVANRLPAALPEFQSAPVLAQNHSDKNTSSSLAQNIFYTGRPFDTERQSYLYMYRDFEAQLSRWTSADPMGFPDGANNHEYAPTPTFQFDLYGCYVSLTYWITQKKLTVEGGETYTGLHSGNDDPTQQKLKPGGPIPVGTYTIYSRHKSGESAAFEYNGTDFLGGYPAWILDPVDGTPLNNKIDGGGSFASDVEGRSAFRLHLAGTTDGCIVFGEEFFAALCNILTQTEPDGTGTIHSGSDTFSNEDKIGTLQVLE